jgi:H+/Cl- antiporter ClcA
MESNRSDPGGTRLEGMPSEERQSASEAPALRLAEQARDAVTHGLKDVVERFNLRQVWYWLGLSSLVGLVGGLGALAFKWLTEEGMRLFWGLLVGMAPGAAGGEPLAHSYAEGPPWIPGLVLAPALGALGSAFLVFRFAPEARGHGTDAAIRAYHRNRGEIRARIPLIKMLASALTLSSGGSAGREGPIAQIGAGFGSFLGKALKLSHNQRRVLLAAGMAAGVGAIFRAPLAGAIFAAEVLYSGPDLEPEVLIPALLSSIVSYSVYCSVHGFGHLFTGTGGFAFTEPPRCRPTPCWGWPAARAPSRSSRCSTRSARASRGSRSATTSSRSSAPRSPACSAWPRGRPPATCPRSG